MDCQMPIMDGVESTIEILKIDKNIPIIGCTAFTTRDQILDCYSAGMKDVIFKPLNLEIIHNIVRNWLN